MNKKIKAIIEFVKVHKKESIGVAVALGIAVVGISGYSISNHYSKSNTEKSSIALADKKEDTYKQNENKDTENKDEASTDSDVVVEEKEDGTLVVKDKEGKTIADSSKGDDVTKIVADKKEAGSNVAIKNNKTGKVEKVEKVENGSITITGGGTVTVKPPVIAENTKPNNPVKPTENKPSNSTGGTESNSNPQINNGNSTPTPPVENTKPVETSKPTEKPQNESKPVEKPVETPKPTEKPVEPVKPSKPKRTWEYQTSMSNELWSLFNQYRQEKGLNTLTWSNKYAGWVKSQAELMAQKEDAIHGNYPEGGDVVGFNGSSMTASKILQQFKNSPQHNKNLLDDELTEGACAVYKDSNGVYYFVIGFDY